MSDKRADPSVLEAMLNKAQNKLKAAGSAFENEFFDDAASCSYYAAYHAVSVSFIRLSPQGGGGQASIIFRGLPR